MLNRVLIAIGLAAAVGVFFWFEIGALILVFACIILYASVDLVNGVKAFSKESSTCPVVRFLALIMQILLGLCAILYLRFISPETILFIVLTVTTADTFAYFSGTFVKWVNKRRPARITETLLYKPFPKISENKTFIGFMSGIIFGIGAGIIFAQALGVSSGVKLSILVTITSMLGDLHESSVKRKLGLKDFGNYLGKHGCISSRIDSHTLAAIAVVVYTLVFKPF